jgi:hypothetical protein
MMPLRCVIKHLVFAPEISCSMRATPICQGGSQPKVVRKRLVSSRELAGALRRGRKAAVGTGSTCVRPAFSACRGLRLPSTKRA